MTAVVVAGSGGLGRAVAERLAHRGEHVVLGGSDAGRAAQTASEIGPTARGVVFDLRSPEHIGTVAADALGERTIDHLVLSSVGSAQFHNSVLDFDAARARQFVELKLLGYVAAIASLVPRLSERAAIVMIGGQGRERPYAGSTAVTAINGAIASLVSSMAIELAPRRVNAVHPGVVGDSPRLVNVDMESVRSRVLTGRLVTVDQIAAAVLFLLDNEGVNGVNLPVDGGWLGV